MITEEKITKTLQDIQARVPKIFRERVVIEKKSTPTMEKVVKIAMEDMSISVEKRNALKILYDNGDFSKTIPFEDKKYVKLIDEFVTREIKKEIKKGNLPKRYEKIHHSKN